MSFGLSRCYFIKMSDIYINPDWFKKNDQSRHLSVIAVDRSKYINTIKPFYLVLVLIAPFLLFTFINLLDLNGLSILNCLVLMSLIIFLFFRIRLSLKVFDKLKINNSEVLSLMITLPTLIPFLGEQIFKLIPINVSIGTKIKVKYYFFIYRTRLVITFFIFLLSSLLFLNIFGGAHCRDGWPSGAIGRQGACSHHGGVRDYSLICFVAGAICAGIFSVKLNGNFRSYYGHLVLNNFPRHPFEELLLNHKDFNPLRVPTVYSSSRSPFFCTHCKVVYAKGIPYMYYRKNSTRYSERIKYCLSCSKIIPILNLERSIESKKHYANVAAMKIQIRDYYAKNSLAVVDIQLASSSI